MDYLANYPPNVTEASEVDITPPDAELTSFPLSSPKEIHEHLPSVLTHRLTRGQSFARANFDPFAGSNQKGVFEDFGEADAEVCRLYGSWADVTSMAGWIFQEVDFTALDAELLLSLPMDGAMFWGCKFPVGVADGDIRRCGASYVLGNPESLPFKPLRAFLYTPKELADKDLDIYHYYKRETSVVARMAYALHDFSMLDALLDYSEGKTFVGVMGGHAVKRDDSAYEELVKLGNLVANAGFICVTGGGPGAMEATNLGAYLSTVSGRHGSICKGSTGRQQRHGSATIDEEYEYRDDEEADREQTSSTATDGFEYRGDEDNIRAALELIRAPTEGYVGEEMHNEEAARRVVERFGCTQCYSPSVGIPTWFYGHEPSNIFASYHAKFFQNSIREDILLDICNGGLIIGPGGPGTFQEVFQACCKNAYTRPGIEYPMIFFGKKFWTDCGVWDVVVKQAKGRPYADLLMISDDIQEIMDHLYNCAVKKRYRLVENPKVELSNPYWYSRTEK